MAIPDLKLPPLSWEREEAPADPDDPSPVLAEVLDRLRDLERRLAALEAGTPPASVPEPVPALPRDPELVPMRLRSEDL